MKFIADINVMPQKALLDPQGIAVQSGLKTMEISGVEDVRIGKHITIKLEANNADEAHQIIENACKKLLANPIMESFEFSISEA
jgi:phosphoribosylformylglycinamidine synthase PurS subunit